ncbi:MAG: DUF3021 domain-containing protein [Ruminococcaceae bacterium]|nr:DUF3021 domain-containing protein [Oscillospiraceae bacterium]
MNRYVKSFLGRGAVFGGFGPIILGIIYFITEKCSTNFSINGKEVFLGIISVYLLAFVQAGASVFNQIEEWSMAKSLFLHLTTLYIAYALCYVVNTWIPFKIKILGIFTAIFLIIYFVVWFTVYFTMKISSKKMNSKL